MPSPAPTYSQAFAVDVFDLPAYGHNHDAWKVGTGTVAVSDVSTEDQVSEEMNKATLAKRIVESLSCTPQNMSTRLTWQQMVTAAQTAGEPLVDIAQVGAALARISEAGVEFSVFGDAVVLVGLQDGRAHWIRGTGPSSDPGATLRTVGEELNIALFPAPQVQGFIVLSGGASRHLEFAAGPVWKLLSRGHLGSQFHTVAADALIPLRGDITAIRVLLP